MKRDKVKITARSLPGDRVEVSCRFIMPRDDLDAFIAAMRLHVGEAEFSEAPAGCEADTPPASVIPIRRKPKGSDEH